MRDPEPELRVGDPLLGPVSGQILDLPADVERDRRLLVRVDVDHRGELFDQRLVARLGICARTLRLVPASERSEHTEPHGRPVIGRRSQSGSIVDPTGRAVREHDPVLRIPSTRRLELGDVLQDPSAIVGMDPPDPGGGSHHHLLVRQSEDRLALGTDVQERLIRLSVRQRIGDDGDRFDESPVEVLGDLRSGRRHPGTLGTHPCRLDPLAAGLATTLRPGGWPSGRRRRS